MRDHPLLDGYSNCGDLALERFPFGILWAHRPAPISEGFVAPVDSGIAKIVAVANVEDVAYVFLDGGSPRYSKDFQQETIENNRQKFEKAGVTHIKFLIANDDVRRSVVMDTKARLYFIEFDEQRADGRPGFGIDRSQMERSMRKVVHNLIEPLIEWTDNNAVGQVALDERGIVFGDEQDAALFRLTYNMKYRPLNNACATSSTL